MVEVLGLVWRSEIRVNEPDYGNSGETLQIVFFIKIIDLPSYQYISEQTFFSLSFFSNPKDEPKAETGYALKKKKPDMHVDTKNKRN